MAWTPEDNLKYRDQMEPVVEALASTLTYLGNESEGLLDHELVELGIQKLKILYNVAKASGHNEELLKAIMKE